MSNRLIDRDESPAEERALNGELCGMRVCIVIPAYEPGGEFVPYAQEVLAAGLGPVLVVDDGSGPAYAPVFAALAEMGCTVLTHEQNRGKGA